MRFCFDQKNFVEKEIQPDKLAVVGADFSLTWNEFNQKVTDLCAYFKDSKVDDLANPIVIYGHKSANMLVAMYSLIKLQIPYIPIDIIYPKNRIEKVVETAQVQLIINTTHLGIEISGTTELFLRKEGVVGTLNQAFEKRETIDSDPVIYSIFTSGSTGEPKGVQISTEAIQSFSRWMTTDFDFTTNDVFVNSAVLSFDLSVFEVITFAALGATLLLNDKETTADPNLLLPRIEKYEGSIWVSTPSFALIYSRLKNEKRMNSIRAFLFCGEVLPHDLAQKLVINYPQARILNTYGPTEATVATTLIEITQGILDQYNPLPVGKSKRESQLIIENDEIIIVGPNVSLGYVANEALNAEKFIQLNGQRAFKTGDKGYLMEDMLFFKGRNDDLIKLHGYRIEINEINAVLNDLEYILHGETLALERNGSVKKIVSLVKLAKNCEIEATQLKSDIGKRLPVYMIPSDIRFVDEIPLNQNGKVDKKMLTEIYLKA